MDSKKPDVRLACNPGPINCCGALDEPAPVVRLAHGGRLAEVNAIISKPDAPTIRLAHSIGAQGDNILTGQRGVKRLDQQMANESKTQSEITEAAPALLVSYIYLPPFLKNQQKYFYRDWVLDSGAFSAHMSGTEIKLQDYIDTAKRLLETDPTLTEVFALDVIGDHTASLRNCEEMWRQGVEAIPCFHKGSPDHALKSMARDYPKIALGGVARLKGKGKMQFAEQCFARVWPKKIHGFGFGTEEAVLKLPFHSVDATNWELGPCAFGRWKTYGNMSVRGSAQDLRKEVEWYLDLERRARHRWKKEMLKLEGAAI